MIADDERLINTAFRQQKNKTFAEAASLRRLSALMVSGLFHLSAVLDINTGFKYALYCCFPW